MTDTNDINFKGTDGDAQGHVYKSGRIDDGTDDDAEGHGRTPGRVDDGSDTDTEGHGTPGKPHRKV